ncbi:MAG: AAA family ATPase [Actinomycetaceae bacterium]|nr:AAA family ATPase [Actinomycetaceae bacterium]
MITKVQIRGYRKFRDFVFEPEPRMNIIVGGNEAGKSTLLEAITLALTGRVGGVRAAEYLNPYWFNKDDIDHFFDQRESGNKACSPPEFQIDVHLDVERGELEKLRGIHNLAKEDSAGLSVWAHPDPDFVEELEQYFAQEDCPRVLPVEYYAFEWRNFAGDPVLKRPKELGISLIDSRTIRSERGVDYYTRQLLESRLDPKDRSLVSVKHRKLRGTLGQDVLSALNKELQGERGGMPGVVVGLQVDQSRSASWENTLIPDINAIPLSMSGQGNQARAKTSLALSRSQDTSNLIFIEEPENHLSHTRLRELISYIQDAAKGRQIYITTHSSYVLNRLGLNQVTFLSNGQSSRFGGLEPNTINYFKRLSGFDTMRLILADKIVVVEGPSDEIVFNRFFKDRYGCEPMDYGIDVMAINGVSFERCFELANMLDRQLFALRDNDGKSVNHWVDRVKRYRKDGVRDMYVGKEEQGNTLESQIRYFNDEQQLRQVFPKATCPIQDWMMKDKTGTALTIAESSKSLTPPDYFRRAFSALEPFIKAES